MKSSMVQFFCAVVLYIGIVDIVDGDIVMAQVTASDNEVRELYLPTAMFPCEIGEGDMFYFSYADGVTEIRCGEPDDDR